MKLRTLVIIVGVLCGAMVPVAATSAVFAVIVNQYGLVIWLIGVATFAIGVASAARKFDTDWITPRVKTDTSGTTFRRDRGLAISLRISFFGWVVSFVAPLLLPADGSPSGAGASSTWLLVIPVVLLVAGGVLTWRSVEWDVGAYLRLTPDGVEIRQWQRVRSCTWDQVTSVTDRLARTPRRALPGIVLTTSDGEELAMMANTFTRNGTTLRDLVGFYWLHSEARGELTDGVAQRRLEERLAAVRG